MRKVSPKAHNELKNIRHWAMPISSILTWMLKSFAVMYHIKIPSKKNKQYAMFDHSAIQRIPNTRLWFCIGPKILRYTMKTVRGADWIILTIVPEQIIMSSKFRSLLVSVFTYIRRPTPEEPFIQVWIQIKLPKKHKEFEMFYIFIFSLPLLLQLYITITMTLIQISHLLYFGFWSLDLLEAIQGIAFSVSVSVSVQISVPFTQF